VGLKENAPLLLGSGSTGLASHASHTAFAGATGQRALSPRPDSQRGPSWPSRDRAFVVSPYRAATTTGPGLVEQVHPRLVELVDHLAHRVRARRHQPGDHLHGVGTRRGQRRPRPAIANHAHHRLRPTRRTIRCKLRPSSESRGSLAAWLIEKPCPRQPAR
jgi:hypothetical protein